MFNFAIQWTAARQASFSFTIYQSLLKLMSIESVILFFLFESVIPSNHLILCHPLLLLLSIFPSIRVFSNESDLRIRWPKYWSFSFSISFSNEYSGLISLGLTGLISLQSKELSKSLLQHHSSKPSILRRSAFTSIHDYWKNHSFDYMDLSLLFKMLSRLVITFLPKSKHLLISWLQSPSAVIFGVQKNKVCQCFPIYLP